MPQLSEASSRPLCTHLESSGPARTPRYQAQAGAQTVRQPTVRHVVTAGVRLEPRSRLVLPRGVLSDCHVRSFLTGRGDAWNGRYLQLLRTRASASHSAHRYSRHCSVSPLRGRPEFCQHGPAQVAFPQLPVPSPAVPAGFTRESPHMPVALCCRRLCPRAIPSPASFSHPVSQTLHPKRTLPRSSRDTRAR